MPISRGIALGANGTNNEFLSPFEEEYDVPTFIRKTRDAD